jgi:aminocarboxymuconate-semialdehyde decarboxylase
MRSIDIHAHLMPQSFWKTVEQGGQWYGVSFEPGDPLGFTVSQGKRDPVTNPKLRSTPEERLKDMDAQDIDVQVVSIATPLFGYYLEPAQGLQLAREVNDEVASMTRQWPQRFAGWLRYQSRM